jgi:hypothetical protein
VTHVASAEPLPAPTTTVALAPAETEEPGTPDPAKAWEGGGSGDEWRISVAPYAWLFSSRGAIKVKDQQVPLEVKFSDAMSDMKFGGSVFVNAMKGQWGFRIDGTYVAMESDDSIQAEEPNTGATITADADYEVGIGNYEVDVLYSPTETLYFIAGVRYVRMTMDVDVEATVPVPPPAGGTATIKEGFEETIDVFGVLAGAEGRWPIADDWFFALRGDFGLGTDVRLGYQVFTVFEWQFAEAWRLGFGYRLVGMEGVEEGDLEMDTRMYGPLLGVAFTF